jgi:hypothetical protein
MTPTHTTPALESSPMAYFRGAAMLAALLFPAAVFGQPPPGYPVTPPPVYVPQPPAQTSANSGLAIPPAAVTAPPPPAYPPGGYSPYGYPAYQGAVGGALSGAANLVGAQGQFEIQNQQARLTQTQADMSRIDYRRALQAEQKYEQAQLPTGLEMRQQQQWRKLQSARNNPPNSEIWSGAAPNALFTALQGAEREGLHADPVPLDPDVLKYVNLTTGMSAAGAGMLKSLGSLNWPFALQVAPFADGQAKVDALARKAVDEIKSTGRVVPATFIDLNAAASALDNAVASNQTLSPDDYISCKSFADDLRSSIQSLRDADVAKYFDGALAPKGPTVADLVRQMSDGGMTFAPATAAGQPAYSALYQALLTYDYRLSQLASR